MYNCEGKPVSVMNQDLYKTLKKHYEKKCDKTGCWIIGHNVAEVSDEEGARIREQLEEKVNSKD